MKVVETTGKTVEEAIEQGLNELNANREEVEVDILDAPSRGLFGFIGSKCARVKVILKEKKTVIEKGERKPEEAAQEFLKKIFEKLEVKVQTEVSQQEDFIYLSFTGDDLGILIGRRGETLDSLQYLVNLVIGRKFGQKYRIVLDVEGYRRRREQTLINLAQRLSEKVKRTGHNIVLEPMNPHERRIIHTALQNDQKVRTFSEGEEPYRKVVITRKK